MDGVTTLNDNVNIVDTNLTVSGNGITTLEEVIINKNTTMSNNLTV
mgnify:CR=1 FL=1